MIEAVVTAGVVVAGGFALYRLLTNQLIVIHDLVNSNLTKVSADLKTALQRIDSLESQLKREKRK